MKSLVFPLLTLSITLALSSFAPDARGQEEMTPMEESMEIINDSYRTIGRGLRRPDPADQAKFVEAATVMEKEAIKCKDLVPMKIKEMPEAEQATAIEKYKEEMDTFIATIGALKTALEAGDFEQASAEFDNLKKEKSEGHEQWKTD